MTEESKSTDKPYPDPELTGPADTDDPQLRVSSTRSTPSETDLKKGTTAAASVIPDAAPPGLLRLVGEPRIEVYEVLSPAGIVVEVTHNIDTSHVEYRATDRTAPKTSSEAG